MHASADLFESDRKINSQKRSKHGNFRFEKFEQKLAAPSMQREELSTLPVKIYNQNTIGCI